MSNLFITNVKTILTAPGGIDLVVVKIETNEPGLYGLGCATFTQRIYAVQSAIDEYLAPFLIGKDPARIEDIWQSAAVSGYWRNGPVMNNALSGIDMALWDIKGKQAGLPVYELLGGKCRDGIALYVHTDGADEVEVEDSARAKMEEGYQYIRCQMGMYGGAGTDDLRLIANRMVKAKNIQPKRSPRTKAPGSILIRKPMRKAFRVCLIICAINWVSAWSYSMMPMNVLRRLMPFIWLKRWSLISFSSLKIRLLPRIRSG